MLALRSASDEAAAASDPTDDSRPVIAVTLQRALAYERATRPVEVRLSRVAHVLDPER